MLSTYEAWIIRVQESKTRSKILSLAFLIRKYKVAFVSGYFADLEFAGDDSPDFEIRAIQTIELKYGPLPSEK